MVVAMKLASFLGRLGASTARRARLMTSSPLHSCVGADILDLNAGRIEEGRLADVCLVDLNTPELVPLNDLTSSLVYATSGSSCILEAPSSSMGASLCATSTSQGRKLSSQKPQVAQRLFSKHR